MDTQLKELKDGKIIRALQLISDGAHKKDACEQVGISTRLLSQALKESPELAAPIIQQRRQTIQDDYENVSDAHRVMLHRLIEWAKQEDLPYKDIAFLEARLGQIEDRLALQLGVSNGVPASEDGTAAAYLKQLTGPALRPGKAVVTRRESITTIVISPEVNTGEIIEAHFSDKQN